MPRVRKRSSMTPRVARRPGSGSTPSSPCTGLHWTSRKKRSRRRKALCWRSCRPSRAPRPRGRLRRCLRMRDTPPRRWPSSTRATLLHPGSSTPRRCDSTSPTRTSAPCCWRARSTDGLEVAQRVREQGAEMPGAAQLVGTAIAGRAALFAGRLDAACALVWETQHRRCPRREMRWAGDTATTFHTPQRWRCGVRRTRRPRCSPRSKKPDVHSAMLDYERSLARAWLAAGQGALTEAITTMLSAAETAAAKEQFAAEVLCLQTAVQFGDHSGASRLSELESIVEGPRAKLAARFAAALADSDGPELAAISDEFEQMGDLVAAVDAAAHACTRVPPQRSAGISAWAAPRARKRWRNDAAGSARLRCARSANRCR